MTLDENLYLKGLNGLRAIAALSVVISHTLMPSFGSLGLPEVFNLPLAEFGVTMFFVISGFLITYLLILEINKTTTVSIKKFYVRRILRIWPIYYLYILIVLIISLSTSYSQDIFTQQIFWYIFFAANIPFIQSTAIKYLVHYWSIGVEEQFYLFWPWIIKYYVSKILYISIGIFAVIFLIKSILWFTLGVESLYYIFFTVSRFHCMMVGAIGAILYESNSIIILYIDTKYFQFISWMCMVLVGFGILNVPAPIAHELFAVFSVSVIVGQIRTENRIINLENNVMNFLGKISYGIYVIHPVIILLSTYMLRQLRIGTIYQYFFVYSLVMGLTIFFAHISYEYYESPFLRMKKRFAVVKTTTFRQ